MLLPRFSLRTTLIVTTVAAVFCLALARAAAGRAWAVGLATAVGVVGYILAINVVFFGISYAFSRLFGVEKVVVRTSQGGVQQDGDFDSIKGKS